MKVIDIDEIIEIVDTKFDEVISKTLNWGDVCMFPNTRKLFNLKIALINELNTFKIIEEPKEDEFEEIELLRDGVHFLGVNLKVNEIIFKEKINELIENQNKIIRELKANKENE